MKTIKLPAGSLLASLMLIIGILTLIFLAKDNWLRQESLANYYHANYLSDKLALVEVLTDPNRQCEQEKKEIINQELGKLNFSFYCQKSSLFIKPKPTREKYIQVDNIKNWLDLDSYQSEIIYISSLAELPINNETEPKIVIAKNAINERLENYFYGIIITDYLFDFTGNKKIYGTVYSTFDNAREERNLTYRRAVIENLDDQYSNWKYIPHSKNILSNDKTN